MNAFVRFLVGLLMRPVLALLDGWVLTKLWHWFVVSTFKLPELGLIPAIGISIVAGFLTYQYTAVHLPEEGKETEHSIQLWTMGILIPLWTLFVGYIVSRFM